MKKLLSVILTGVLAFSVVGCGANNSKEANTNKSGEKILKLGVNGTDFRVWDSVNERLKKDNIKLEVVSFSDYVKPNLALSEGEIDLNAFQTVAYFEQFKKDRNLDLSSLGYTILAPMGIYSQKIKSIGDAKNGDKVAIPNDPTNGGRALLLLEAAKLIKLDGTNKVTPTVKNIVENPKNLEIVEMVAAQIPRSLQDVAFACINNGVAVDAKLVPNKDSIFLESTDGEDVKNYFNIIACKTENKDKPEYKKVIEVYQQEETKKAIDEVYQGSALPAFK
jgi:D-methionine transport system substrate-binding protein